jgi:hypothetical protein
LFFLVVWFQLYIQHISFFSPSEIWHKQAGSALDKGHLVLYSFALERTLSLAESTEDAEFIDRRWTLRHNTGGQARGEGR